MKSFRLLLPNTDAASAREIGEAVRASGPALGLPNTTSSHQCVTADAALYAAKHCGRNTVVEHGMVRASDGAAEMAWAS